MHRKQNRSKPKNHGKIMTTADMTNVLRTINQNASWKNKSSKININKSPIGTITQCNNQMTEADIQKLFLPSNEKKSIKPSATSQKLDFISKINFLKMDDDFDKFLTGIEMSILLKENKKIEEDSKIDLTKKFKQDYLVGKIIGQGAYASVRVAIYKPENKKIAIKVYEKEKIKQIQRKKSVRRQIKILQMIDHPNIVKLFNVVQTNNHLNLIMQYLSGVSLCSFLKNQPKQKINENACKQIIKSLTKALQYLHHKRIAHRDIKLQNIILDSELNPKLIDFGFSTCIEASKKLKIFCGTPSYMAPEIVQRKEYRGQTADIWALGVLFYIILVGVFPFKGSTDEQLHQKINRGDYPKTSFICSREADDLVGRMLTVDPDKRITARQILEHPWMDSLNSNYSQKLSKKKTGSSDLKKRTITVSSNKSKEQIKLRERKKLNQTCKENLKLQLQETKNSGNQFKRNFRLEKELLKMLKTEENREDGSKIKRGKRGQKMMEVLKMQMKKKEQSKSKNRRL